MKIPKSVKLCGLTVNTVYDNSLGKEKGCVGQSLYQTQEIKLDDTVTHRETLEQGYCHEWVHWALYVMNRHELRNDEDFVDSFAHLLYQSIQTATFEEE